MRNLARTIKIFALLLVMAGLLLAAGLHAQTVFNCSSFTSSGTCSVAPSFPVPSTNFWVRGGGNLSGSQINFVPTGSTHNGYGLWYSTTAGIQAFSTTFTFVPNGWNFALVLQNTTSTPGYQGNTFSSGASCEAGFYQDDGVDPTPNNLFAIDFDSSGYIGGSFSYSTVQMYQQHQSPCQPNDGGAHWYSTTKTSTSPVPLTSPASTQYSTTGDTYSATVTYDGATVTLNMYDVTASGSCPGASCFTKSWSNVSIPSLVNASTSYIGFTSGVGSGSPQEPTLNPLYVKSWSFTTNTPTATPTYTAWNANSTYNNGTVSAASPIFSVAPGTYSGTQTVSLVSTTTGANICYSLASSTPAIFPQVDNNGGCAAGTLYSGPISISSSNTLYAMAGTAWGTGPPSTLVAGAYIIGGGCTLSSGATVSQMQTAINSAAANACPAPSTATVSFGAGSYTISSQLSIPCPTTAMTITGPAQPTNVWPITPTAILSSTLGNNWAISGAACTHGTTFQFLEYNGNQPPGGGGGFLHVNQGMQNLTVQYNWIHGNMAIQTSEQFTDDMIYLDGNYGSPSTQNTTIRFNRFGATGSGDCGGNATAATGKGVMSLMGSGGGPGTCYSTSPSGYAPPSGASNTAHTCLYQGAPNDNSGGGACGPFGLHHNTDNFKFINNSVQEQEQGGKCFQNNSGTTTSTNTLLQFNDWSGIHRIGYEAQCNDGLTTLDSNDFHDPFQPNANSWAWSVPQGNTASTNNVAIANTSIQNDRNGNPASYAGYGIEFWGGLTSSNNLLQGLFGGGIAWGFQPGGASINNNIIQLSTNSNYISCCDQGASNPPSQSGNVTSGTVTTRTSFAPTSISPPAGAQSFPLTVTLTDPGYTSGAGPKGNTGIWYTIDGTTPVPGSGSAKRLDTGGTFVLSGPATVQAVGMWGALNQPTSYKSGFGFVPSAVVSAAYTSGGAVVLSSATISATGGVTTLTVGGTVQMIVICHYSDGSTSGCNTTDSHNNAVTSWASSSGNVTVCPVNSTTCTPGTATGAAVGTATITATVTGGFTTSPGASLSVSAPPLTLGSISVATTGGVTSITASATNQLLTTCHYNDGTSGPCNTMDSHGNAVTSSNSSAPAVATVTSPGSLVTGVAAGSTNLTTTVTPTPSMLGTSLENVSGATGFGFINEIYGVTGTAAGGYSPGDCHITIQATSNWTAGKQWTCLLVLGTPTTQNAAALCSNSYTLTGTSWPGGDIVIPMAAVCPALPPDQGYWVGSTTSQTTASPAQGFSNCNSACNGSAPVFGSGTYPYCYVANTFGSYTALPTSFAGCSTTLQVSQYILLTATPVTSNSLPLTVTGSPPTLLSAYITGASSLVVPNTAQMAAKCHYSSGADQDCTVADIYGDAVSAWLTSDATKATVQNVGQTNPGQVAAVAAGTPNITAVINNSFNSTAFPITITTTAVTLTGVSLSTAGGVTGLFVGQTNQLKAICTYSDGSSADCTSTANTWTSTTPAHATINPTTGLVMGVAPGTTTFTAHAGSFTSGALPLTVLAVPSGTYIINLSGPIAFSGTVTF